MVQPGLLPVPGQSWPNQLLLQLQRLGAAIAQFLRILQAQEVLQPKDLFSFLSRKLPMLQTSDAAPRFVVF